MRPDVAMTGEVTLRGRVLPVGGVREKSLAALRHGIRTVVLPRACLKDVDEIPKELKRRITFVPVSHMHEVLEVALERSVRWTRPAPAGPSLSQPATVSSKPRQS